MVFFFFVKQKTAYEMRISDWSSDVCSSDLCDRHAEEHFVPARWRVADADIIVAEIGAEPQIAAICFEILSPIMDRAKLHFRSSSTFACADTDGSKQVRYRLRGFVVLESGGQP